MKSRVFEVEEKLAKGEKVDSRLCCKSLQFFAAKKEFERVQCIHRLMIKNGIKCPNLMEAGFSAKLFRVDYEDGDKYGGQREGFLRKM